jgi:UDP:flavonoid glycosyltransferase YjiC (YdhE family)
VRILFTSNPGFGHVHPMVPLARALAGRGHEIRWAVAPEACGRVRAAGFEPFPAGLGGGERRAEFDRCLAAVSSLPPDQRPDRLFPAFFGEVCTGPMLDDLLPMVDSWRPALIVNDASELAAPLAGRLRGVPHVTHAFGALLPERRVAAAGAVVAPLWRAHGLTPDPYAGSYNHPYLDIYPPSMRFGSYHHVPEVQALRPVPFDAAGDEPVDPVTAGERPLVYVTFGTVFNDPHLFGAVMAAVGRLDVDVLVTVGPVADPRALGEVPPNVRVERYVPQTAVLPHCAAVASHAGSGTFLAALGLGIPQLCLPQAADQFINATQGAACGAALTLAPAEATADAIADALGRLLAQPVYAASARMVAEEMAAMPGPDDVAVVLEALA